jgi:uncharacterized protein
MAKNTFCHIEWEVTDLDRAQAFYGGMFDWKFESFGDQMVVFGTGTQHLGGLSKAETVNAGRSPSVWIEADDISEYEERCKQLGGSVTTPKHELPHVGWSASIADPDGNHIGLVQFDRK